MLVGAVFRQLCCAAGCLPGRRGQPTWLRSSNAAETVRYDASDKMPAEMEAAFRAKSSSPSEPGNLDTILADLDAIQDDAYAGIEAADPPASAAPPADDAGLGGEINILAVWADAEGSLRGRDPAMGRPRRASP